MKKLTFGNPSTKTQEFYQIENYHECGTRRISEINQYLVKAEIGETAADFSKNIAGFRQSFDASKMADAWEYLFNLEENAKAITEGISAFEYMFAIIVLNEEETNEPGLAKWLQPTYLKEKINTFRDLNVTNKDIAEISQFFFLSCYPHWPLASPIALSYLLRWLQSMTMLEKSLESLGQTMNSPKGPKS